MAIVEGPGPDVEGPKSCTVDHQNEAMRVNEPDG